MRAFSWAKALLNFRLFVNSLYAETICQDQVAKGPSPGRLCPNPDSAHDLATPFYLYHALSGPTAISTASTAHSKKPNQTFHISIGTIHIPLLSYEGHILQVIAIPKRCRLAQERYHFSTLATLARSPPSFR